MKKFSYLFLFLIGSSCTKSEKLSDIPFSVGKVRLGIPLDSVPILVYGYVGDGNAQCLEFRSGGEFFVDNVHKFEFCSLTANRRLTSIVAIDYSMNENTYKYLCSDIAKKYGAPAKKDSTTTIWDSPSAILMISHNSPGYGGTGTLSLKDTTLVAKMSK